MKFLFLLIFVATVAKAQQQLFPDAGGIANTLHRKFPNATLSSLLYRFPRDAGDDNLKTFVNNLKMIARITNGIYLQQGLTSGSIPSDDLISELLHFGSVKPSNIAKMDIVKIQAVVDTLKELPISLKPVGDGEEAVKRLNALKEILEAVDGVGDIKTWNGRAVFEAITNGLAKDGVDLKFFTGFGDTKIDFDSAYKNLAGTSKLKDSSALVYFENLKNSLTWINTAGATLIQMGRVWKNDKYTSTLDSVAPIVKASTGVKKYLEHSLLFTMSDKIKTALDAHVKELQVKIDSIKSVESNLKSVNDLLMARTSPKHGSLPHTRGLPLGIADLKMMFVDFSDNWVRGLIGTEQLESTLAELKNLEGPSNKVISLLDVNKNDGSQMATLLKIKDYSLIGDAITWTQSLSTATSCKGVVADVIDTKNLDDLLTILKSIDNKFIKIDTAVRNLIEALNDQNLQKMCDEILMLCEQSEITTDQQPLVENFRKIPSLDDLKSKIEHIYTIVNSIGDVQKDKTIQAKATDAQQKFQDLADYHKALDHYADYFSCLQGNQGLKSVLRTMAEVEKIRKLGEDPNYMTSLDNGMAAVKKVVDTKEELKKLEDVIAKMKGVKSTELDALKELKDASKHSQIIGLAIQGVDSMKLTLGEKSKVQLLITNADVIKHNLQKLPQDSEDVKNLNELLALPISKMYATLDAFRNGIGAFSESKKLEDQSVVFTKAGAVSGVYGDFMKMEASVEKLKALVTAPEDPKKLDDVREILKTMDSLHLDFASYKTSFLESKKTLAALDTFFLDFVKRTTPTTAPPPKVPKQKSPENQQIQYNQGAQNMESGPVELKQEDLLIFYAIGAFAGILGSCVLGHCILWKNYPKKFFKIYKCCKKDPLSDTALFPLILNEVFEAMERFASNAQLGNETTDLQMLMFYQQLFLVDLSSYKLHEKDYIEFPEVECRYNSKFNKKYAVKISGRNLGKLFPDSRIHASRLDFPDYSSWFLTQAPQNDEPESALDWTYQRDTESYAIVTDRAHTEDRLRIIDKPCRIYKQDHPYKNSNVVKFWWMVKQKKSKSIVMTCRLNRVIEREKRDKQDQTAEEFEKEIDAIFQERKRKVLELQKPIHDKYEQMPEDFTNQARKIGELLAVDREIRDDSINECRQLEAKRRSNIRYDEELVMDRILSAEYFPMEVDTPLTIVTPLQGVPDDEDEEVRKKAGAEPQKKPEKSSLTKPEEPAKKDGKSKTAEPEKPKEPEKVPDTTAKIKKKKSEVTLVLKCLKKQVTFGGLLEVRDISGQFDDEKEFFITHYWFLGWPMDKGKTFQYPTDVKPLVWILKAIANDPTPPIIHDSDGITQIGCLALTVHLKKETARTRKWDMRTSLKHVNTVRPESIRYASDYAFSVYLLLEMLLDGSDIPDATLKDRYDTLRLGWQNWQITKEAYDAKMNGEGNQNNEG